MVGLVGLDDFHVIAGDHAPDIVRERLDRRLGGHEIIALAADGAKEKLGAVLERSIPIRAQCGDEGAARGHVPQLGLEQRTEPRLRQPSARRPEQEHMREPVPQLRILQERALHDQPAHAVGGKGDHLATIERRKRQRCSQAFSQDINIGVARPYAGDVDADARTVSEAEDAPRLQLRLRHEEFGKLAPGRRGVSAEPVHEGKGRLGGHGAVLNLDWGVGGGHMNLRE